MRTGIHPEYVVAQVSCACGNIFTTRSTVGDLKVEICSACHPFYTGVQKMLDSAGRVERFQKRFSKTGGRTLQREKKTVAHVKMASISTKTKSVLTTTPTTKESSRTKAAAKPTKKG